jgi:hypothetical protein
MKTPLLDLEYQIVLESGLVRKCEKACQFIPQWNNILNKLDLVCSQEMTAFAVLQAQTSECGGIEVYT